MTSKSSATSQLSIFILLFRWYKIKRLAQQKESSMLVKVQVWDLAVRVFHWSQVVLLAALWYTGNEGLMAQHQLLAYTLAALLIARICWGFYGSVTARFSHFAASPLAAIRYLRNPKPVLGHNPAGGYMIFALLLLLSV